MRNMLLALCLILSFNLKAQQPKTPAQVVNYMTTVVDSLRELGRLWGVSVGEGFGTRDFSMLAVRRKNLEDFIVRRKAALIGLKDVGDMEEMRGLMLNFLDYEKHLIEKAFSPFEKIDSSYTRDEIGKMVQNMQTIAEEEITLLEKFAEAQIRYSRRHNLKTE